MVFYADCLVALRKESVDRNPNYIRRLLMSAVVALRKESVDRNTDQVCLVALYILSLSARRAWIEIRCARLVAGRPNGRSPQGERG